MRLLKARIELCYIYEVEVRPGKIQRFKVVEYPDDPAVPFQVTKETGAYWTQVQLDIYRKVLEIHRSSNEAAKRQTESQAG